MFDEVVSLFIFQDNLKEKYDQIQFIEPECHTHYYCYLLRTKLPSERAIFLENMSKKVSIFHDRLMAKGWWCFTLVPCMDNKQ